MGLDRARRVLGDLADDAAKGIPTILTAHRRPVARIVALETEDDKRWDAAVGWLVTSEYVEGSPQAKGMFWAIVNGECGRDNVAEWYAREGRGQ